MKRDRTSQVAVKDKPAAPKNWGYIAMNTAAAAGFFFMLQRYAMNASLDSSLLWALGFGGCAAVLAYMQSTRSPL
jgi:hypothetical protein